MVILAFFQLDLSTPVRRSGPWVAAGTRRRLRKVARVRQGLPASMGTPPENVPEKMIARARL